VPNGITYSSAGSMARIDVLQNPTNGDFARFILTPEFKTVGDVYDTIFFPIGLYLERAFDVFGVTKRPISLPSIEAGSYSEFIYGKLLMVSIWMFHFIWAFTRVI